MIGMAIAVVTTLVTHFPEISGVASGVTLPGQDEPYRIVSNVDIVTLCEILAAIVIGGGIGLVIARKIQMTAMPQLVAAFHSLVGMAAVLVGAAAYLNPEAFGIATRITPITGPPSSTSSRRAGSRWASASRSARSPSRAR